MKKNQKEKPVRKDNLPGKSRNAADKNVSGKNRVNMDMDEYEEDRSMNIRMKPQPFNAAGRNTSHEDNKDE